MPEKYSNKCGRDNKCSGIPTSRYTHSETHTAATHLQSLYVFIYVRLCGFDNGEHLLLGTTAYGKCPCYTWAAFKFSNRPVHQVSAQVRQNCELCESAHGTLRYIAYKAKGLVDNSVGSLCLLVQLPQHTP